VEVGGFVRTAGMCPVCKTAAGLNLSDREFTCSSCGSPFDGDAASAVVILKEVLCPWDAGETPGTSKPLPSACRNTSRIFPM
jgi:transposase